MIREIIETDLKGLLLLYEQLHGNSYQENLIELNTIWRHIYHDKNYHIIIAEKDGEIVSSCVLIIIPNLTHQLRPYALIENVITDKKYRKQGFATQCLDFAKEIAIIEKCYKIMLMTGSKERNTLHFYEQAGYNQNDKTAFIQWIL